jgi:peptidoglycan/LPS O-acetylase OafA/YrhL
MSTKLSIYVGNRDNNFNLLRFIAASLVIISHAYPLILGRGNWDPFRDLTGGLTFGTLAVDVFFITSGFLITSSLLRNENIIAFCWARIIRIYPALFASILFCVFVIGVYYTKLPLGEYLTEHNLTSFIVKNTSLVWKLDYSLPGVFADNPYAKAINGSLWTLPWEVRMYALLGFCWLLFKVRLTKAIIFLVVFALIALLTLKIFYSSEPKSVTNLFRFITFFFSGALFFIFQDKIKLNGKLCFLFLGILVSCLFINSAVFYIAYTLFLGYIILYIAYVPAGIIRKYNKVGDYSYGVYIYAFPVQQSLVASFPNADFWALVLMTWLITLCLAILSWHFIEKPMLAKKDSYKPIIEKIRNIKRNLKPSQ